MCARTHTCTHAYGCLSVYLNVCLCTQVLTGGVVLETVGMAAKTRPSQLNENQRGEQDRVQSQPTLGISVSLLFP